MHSSPSCRIINLQANSLLPKTAKALNLIKEKDLVFEDSLPLDRRTDNDNAKNPDAN